MLILILALAAAAAAARAESPEAEQPVRLRGWFLGLQTVGGERDRWDVFNLDGLPPAAVSERGRGGGLHFGRRFGGRFLLGLQMTVAEHDLAGLPERIYDGEFLLTGTVLFRERATVQPFVRGGLGGGIVVLERPGGAGNIASFGPAAIAGGGLQVRLSSRFSLELEAVANFTNFLEVQAKGGDGDVEADWRVKTSQVGWRTGVGVMVWF